MNVCSYRFQPILFFKDLALILSKELLLMNASNGNGVKEGKDTEVFVSHVFICIDLQQTSCFSDIRITTSEFQSPNKCNHPGILIGEQGYKVLGLHDFGGPHAF